MKSKAVLWVTCGLFLVFFSLAYAEPQSVGFVTAVKSNVTVIHAGSKKGEPVKKKDTAFFQDVYETGPDARAKLLFADDSIITIGPGTKLALTESIYNPANNQRSAVVSLVSGKARALVGKAFSGSGSKFEVHTPTAVAAARGTYFVVWIFEQEGKLATGVWSNEGAVDVSNIKGDVIGTVQIANNQFTIIGFDTPPVAVAIPDSVLIESLLSGTELEDQPSEEEIPPMLTEPEEANLPEVADVATPIEGQPAGEESAAKEKGAVEEGGAEPDVADSLTTTPPIEQTPEVPTTEIELKFEFK